MQSDLSAGEDLITLYKMKKFLCAVLSLLLVVCVCAGCSLKQTLEDYNVNRDTVKDVVYTVKNPIDVDAAFDSDFESAEFDISLANRDGGETTYTIDADLTPVKAALEQIPKEGKYDINIKLGTFLDQTYEFDFSDYSLIRIK